MHKVKVVQTYKVVREIVIEVDAPSQEDAVERQFHSDAPSYDDPRWTETRVLKDEEVLNG